MPLYMAGRFTPHDHTDDQRIWWSRTYDGNNWNGMNEVPGANSKAGPWLAVFNDQLYMVYGGVFASGTTDRSIWWTRFDGNTWAPVANVLDPEMRFNQTANRPCLIAKGDRLHLYWAGHLDNYGQPDPKIYHAIHDGQKWENAGALFSGLPYGVNGIYMSNSHTADIYLLTRDGDSIIMAWSSDGFNFDLDNRVVLPHQCLGLPSLVGFPSFGTAKLMVTFVKPGGGGLFGSVSTDHGHSWGPEFVVTNQPGNRPNYGTWGSADPFAVWVGGGYRVYAGRPQAGSTWQDPATGNALAPDQQPVYQLSSAATPSLAAYGDILFP
ncbi:hypothetical protein [Stackebrandtia nassauensis]|uniref:Uncharacterized protein n=1 Tax=Stackebrandtia nassauensis (strain DSM 44728 / CIP 108903 / NRRL B-16338 / NBRC 102104 / LLR-40K-21) TaxID=446470 RepID=D3Q7Q4_STANL|nr:hypothetical protein [Stackebrandtia nassauensis]ADD44396.1 hypothetical protein Snas_4754 [Stackebrandtia nassauensis DSM 44728]